MFAVRLALLMVIAGFGVYAAAPPAGTEMPLWEAGAPHSEAFSNQKEMVDTPEKTHDNTRVHNIHNPSLTIFLTKENASGTAVIIAPGGGHRFLSIDTEGYNVARFLNTLGVSAFVLKYRLAHEQGSPYKVEVEALADAQRAIRLVRSRAQEWSLDPTHVVMMGFSAGGELAGLAATDYDTGTPDSADPVERQGSRPDFQALIYPGGTPDRWNFTKNTPPAFLLGADNDPTTVRTVPVIYAALKKVNVPAELHIYVDGGHGFGVRDNPKPFPSASTWQLRFGDWLKDRGLLRTP